MNNNKISVSEALQKLEAGESVSDYSIDFDRIKVEVLDVMKLSKGGIEVPEAAIYYNDADIQYDDDFEGDWIKVNTISKQRAAAMDIFDFTGDRVNVNPSNNPKQTEIKITLPDDMKEWVESNKVPLDELIEKLLAGFYSTQKMVSEKQ